MLDDMARNRFLTSQKFSGQLRSQILKNR